MKTSIHEDSAGALILAQSFLPQHTLCSKYYAIKTVWPRVKIILRGIKLLKLETVEQLGDALTKALTRVMFGYLQKKLMGW